MTKRKRRGVLALVFAAVFLLSSLGFELYNTWDDARAGRSAQTILASAEREMPKALSASVSSAKPVKKITADTPVTLGALMGILKIPSLGLTLPIQRDYSLPLLKNALCRFTGDGNISRLVICGHNYSRFFKNLKNVKKGDTVLLTDMSGRTYRFAVSGVLVVAANDWNALKTGDWDMTLFTCTVGGLKRVLVRCALVS